MLLSAARSFQGNDYAAGIDLTDALRADIIAIRKGNMYNASFVRRHSLKSNRTAIVTYLLRDTQGKRTQVFLATLPIVFRVSNVTHSWLGRVCVNQVDRHLRLARD